MKMEHRDVPYQTQATSDSKLLDMLLSFSYSPGEGIGRENFFEKRRSLLNSLYGKEIPGLGTFYMAVHNAAIRLTEEGVFSLSLGFPVGLDVAYELAGIGYETKDIQVLREINPRIVAVVKAKYPHIVRNDCPIEKIAKGFEQLYQLGIMYTMVNE